MRFRYTILYVGDVARSISFYERALGIPAGFVHDGGDYGELETGSTRLAFSSRALMRSLGKQPGSAQPEAPVFEIAFETGDVAAALNRALAAGGTLVQKARREEWGQDTAYFSDPDGYLVELCSAVDPVANPG